MMTPHTVMAVLAAAAGSLHLFECLVAIHVTRTRYQMTPATVAMWAVNVLIVGIFGQSYCTHRHCGALCTILLNSPLTALSCLV